MEETTNNLVDEKKEIPLNPYMFEDEPARFDKRDLERLLVHCVKHNVSDLTLQTNEKVWVEIYGKLYQITKHKLNTPEMNNITNLLYGDESAITKLSSGTDLDWAYEVKPDRATRLRFRLNATNCSVLGNNGIQITVRTIPGVPPELSKMSVEKEIIENMTPKQGLVLVTGATGSGKSTLLSAVLRHVCEDPNGNRKILTYEHPIEFVYDDVHKPSTVVSQSEVGRHLPSFAAGVRNALRRKPMIILIGEARDAETIGEAVTASMTGHLVYSTVHSNGVADTVRRMVNVFPEGEKHARAIDIISSLKLIVSQMLIPSTDGKRVALREYLVFTDEVVDQMIEGGVNNLTLLTRKLVKKHGQTFLMDATNKFNAGIISEREFRKIKALTDGMNKDVEEYTLGKN